MKQLATLWERFPGIASILRNGAFLTGTQWAEAGLRGLYAILIARLLGPELYGVWSLATTTYAFVISFTFFGLETIIPLKLGQDRNASRFLGTTFMLRFALVVLAAVLLTIYAFTAEGDPSNQLALMLVLPALIGRGLVLWARTVFLGLDRSSVAFRLAVGFRLIEVCLGLTLLYLGAGVFALLTIHAGAWLAEAAFSFRAVQRNVDIPRAVDRTELKDILARGSVLGLSAAGLGALTAVPLIYTRFLTNDLDVVGQLALASQIAALVVMGIQGVFSAAVPIVGRAMARSDPRLRNYPGLLALLTVLVFAPAILIAHLWGPAVIPVLLGERFVLASELLAPALLVGGLSVLPAGFWHILVAQHRIWTGVPASWAAVMVLLIALPPMVDMSGAFGALMAAALAWAVRSAILIAWALVLIRRG
jgi:O-antigen/teichoic acid export membrane protein